MKRGKRKSSYNTSSDTNSKVSNPQNSEIHIKKKGLSSKQKKAIKVGIAVAGTAIAAYGAYKVHDLAKSKNIQINIGQKFVKSNIDSVRKASKLAEQKNI